MIFKGFILFSLLLMCNNVYSQKEKCKTYTPMKKFNPSSFLGTWFEYRRLQVNFETADCVSVKIDSTGDGKYSLGYSEKTISTGTVKKETGKVNFPDDGKIVVEFPGVNFNSTFTVLNTDYNQYAIVSTCYNTLVQIWVLSRTRTIGIIPWAKISKDLVFHGIQPFFTFQNVEQNEKKCYDVK